MRLDVLCRDAEALDAVAHAAVLHGVDRFLVEGLAVTSPAPAMLRSLRARAMMQTAAIEHRLIRPLWRALAALDAAHVTVVALKGPVLAARLLGDLCARESNDLDLLIAPADYPAAMAALLGTGWTTHDSQTTPPVTKALHHATLHEPASGACLELHYSPGTDAGIAWPVAKMIARAPTVTVDGRAVRVLDPADEFVFLATHGLKHQLRRLQWLLDLALLARQVDLAAVERRARELGALHVVRLARHVCTVMFGVSWLPGAAWRVAPRMRYDAARALLDAGGRNLLGGLARKALQLVVADWPGGTLRTLLAAASRARLRVALARA